ncbi:hypothetical protein [Bauldia sp.]
MKKRRRVDGGSAYFDANGNVDGGEGLFAEHDPGQKPQSSGFTVVA